MNPNTNTFPELGTDLPYGLRRRLSGVFLLIIIVLSALNAFNLLWMGLYYRQLSIRLEHQANIQDVMSLIQLESTNIYNYSRSGNSEYLENRTDYLTRIADILESLKTNTEHRSRSWYRLSDVIRMEESYLQTEENLLNETKTGVQTIYLHDRGDELVRISGYITAELQQYASASMDRLSDFYKSFSRRITRISSFSLILLGLTLSLAIYSSRRFVLSVTRPIHLLATNLIRFGDGNLETRVGDVGGRDEIAVLGMSFNRMADRIRGLIRDIRDKAELEQRLADQQMARQEAERLLKEAELAHLHAQINPHFLFNTLNMLGSLSVVENAPKTGRVVSDLSDLLRYSLRTGSGLVKLSAELAVVRSYMNIQKLRFADRLTYNENVDESAQDLMIPGMVLQPLAENAVKHGLEPIERHGSLSLTVSRSAASVEICLEDDGVGISDRALAILDDPEIQTRSLGIRNVRRRLAIHFGKDVLTIQRGNHSGTLCRIVIPV